MTTIEVYNIGGSFSHTENAVIDSSPINDGETKITSIVGADSSLSEPMTFVYDSGRSTWLSSTMEHIGFTTTTVATDDYIPSGATIAGVVLPFGGTIISATGTTSDSNFCARSLSIYINGVEQATGFVIGAAGTNGPQNASKTDINIPFNAGDTIQARMRYSSGTTKKNIWTNLALNVFYKWRIS